MNKITKAAIAVGITAAAAALYPATAHADISDTAVAVYGEDSWHATCKVLGDRLTGDVVHDADVLYGVDLGIAAWYHIDVAKDAPLVSNYQVYFHCDKYWPNLVAVGEWARSYDAKLQYS